MEETIKYKGYTIEVIQDTDPVNPFEEWDGLFPIIVKGNRYTKDYSNGDIERYLVNYLTDNQLSYKMNKILSFIGMSKEDFDLDYPIEDFTKGNAKSGRADYLRDLISEHINGDLGAMAEYCAELNIKHYYSTSRGYCQSSWADVFVCWTPEFSKITGLSYTKATIEDMKGTFDIYGYWAWGDVYGWNVKETDDSCWGYYGDDHEKSGLLEAAKDSINYTIESEKRKHFAKIKSQIKGQSPLNARKPLSLKI